MNTTHLIAAHADATAAGGQIDTQSALKFITCGSVDDGKSTLIGRLLIDSRSVLLDQLVNVSKSGEADLAQFTDGLSAEREQGITIDVAYHDQLRLGAFGLQRGFDPQQDLDGDRLRL